MSACELHPNKRYRDLPLEQQQKLLSLDAELNGLDLSKPVKVDKYGYISNSNKPPQLKDKINLFREGNEVRAYSLEEAKVILNDTGAKPKHGTNFVDPPHIGSDVATPLERVHYHINTDKGTIILPFIN